MGRRSYYTLGPRLGGWALEIAVLVLFLLPTLADIHHKAGGLIAMIFVPWALLLMWVFRRHVMVGVELLDDGVRVRNIKPFYPTRISQLCEREGRFRCCIPWSAIVRFSVVECRRAYFGVVELSDGSAVRLDGVATSSSRPPDNSVTRVVSQLQRQLRERSGDAVPPRTSAVGTPTEGSSDIAARMPTLFAELDRRDGVPGDSV